MEKQETKSDKWYCDACESTFKKPANPLTRIVRNMFGMKKTWLKVHGVEISDDLIKRK